MLKILLVLLPLAASAECSYRDLSACTKCAVGAIGMQFSSFTPCNCNDNAGMYGMMCPKTGAPTLPTCCSVDGKAATVQTCKCGTSRCREDQKCTAATNKCEYPVCAKTDGSAASTSETECQCGTTSCSKGQKCTASTNTCESGVCSSTDGKAAITSTNCKCGTATCYFTTDTCTASTNTCKSPTVAPATAPAACKEDVAVTAKCTCGTRSTASIGQTCPSTGANKGVPQWPACSGSDVFKTVNQYCTCADKSICRYGQKCTQAGDFKGICECVLSDDVMCMDKVPPTEKCPKTCDGHTTMGAISYAIDKCIPNTKSHPSQPQTYMQFTAANNKITYGTYSDSACKTMVGKMTEKPAGCQDDMSEFWALSPKNAGGSTALQVAMPVALVAGLLGFILL